MSNVVTVPGVAVANDRLLAVSADVNGQPYVLIVDTGATHIALLPEIITRDLALPRLPEPIEQFAIGRPEATQVPLYRLDQISVGGLMLEDLDVVALDWPRGLNVQGILGMNFLDAFPRFCLDLATPSLELHLDR